MSAGTCYIAGEADATENTQCDDGLWRLWSQKECLLATVAGKLRGEGIPKVQVVPTPAGWTAEIAVLLSGVCRRRPTCASPLARRFEAEHFLWNTSAMSMFSSRQQTLNRTCKSHCTVANPTRLRRQHHTCVLQSLQQAASISESQSTGSHSHKSARKLACRPLWHAAQHRRRQLSRSNATRFEDGEAESTGVTNAFDDDELTALDGEIRDYARIATAAPPGMP